eukprot:gene28135-biopygen32088
MFSITVPNVDLPVDLGFTQDFDLKLAIGDDGDVVVCGRHWTLFTTVTQPMADFEAAYGILQQTAMVSCAAAAAAEPPPPDIDDSCMPFDKLTYAVVVALEELVDNSCCPNTRVFAWLYAKHLRAADMDFTDLLQTPAIANMASTALDAWFVRHPMFRAQAHEAQDLLITVLDDYTPSRPRYEPYWAAPERIYTQQHIEKFMDALLSATKYFVDQQHMDVVILEKPNPRRDKKHVGMYKDGLHVVMPNVITHPEIQLAIRDHFVNDATENMAYGSTVCIPRLSEMDPGKIYDESVIKRGGRWFLYGSKKPDEAHPWKVTAWYQFDIAAFSVAKRDVQQMDLDTLVQKLSIRVHPQGWHSPYTKHGQEEMVIRGDYNLSEPKKTFDSHHGMDVESLYNLVDILDAHRARGYDSWLKIGMALKNTVDTGTDTQRLEIWKAFAKKCPSKFCDTMHEKVWANLKPQKITLGTLCFLAKEDDPMGYSEWVRQCDNKEKKPDVQLDKDRIINDLKLKLIHLHIDKIMLDVVNESIEFKLENGAKGAIHKNQYMVEVDDKYYGSLIDKFPIHEDPGFIKNVPIDKGPYECELRTMDGKTINSAIVKSTDVHIAFMNIGSDNQYVNVQSITCNACKILDKHVINAINNMIFKAQESHAKNTYGITQNIFLVNNTINIHMVLAEKFRYAAPEFFSRIKFVPEVKKKECVGDMYYCDPATNRWSNCSNTKITNAIATEFNSKFPSEKNNKKIRLFLDTVRGRSAFLQSVASLVLDETFADNLDSNPDLFAVNNGVFDSSLRDTVVFRNVEMTDNISRCAKWDYQGEDNHHLQRCKEELDDFLRKVMPVDEERDVVLAFFAGLLSGRRKEKKFLAFTDKTSGDNGKSTLMALLGSFFDEYGSSNGTKFMTKGSFARSRDDHDAGLKPMKGVRLLVAEEMKPNIALDEAFIKRIAGGEGVRVGGRSCGTGNSFDFLWQAGIVLVFNEGDCPKFDVGDSAFVKRMVVVPMRSNFVLHPEREHEFERRDDLADALPTWRSALAQLLIEHFRRPGRSSIFDNLPVSMTEWKSCIADSANPLTAWLEEVVEVTGASSDAVWIGDLKVRWKESHHGEASVFSTKLVKAFFVGKQGIEWKETGRIETKVKYGKSLQPLMWDMLAAGGNESCKELLNTFRVAYATGLIDYIRQMCGDDVCNPKQVGTVNVNYSSDIDVNLNFNWEILHNDLDRIVLIFKSINDYHYQRFKRNFTDMFDINIYGSHFGMLNNPKSAKSKEEIDLISNDPQQRLFAMGMFSTTVTPKTVHKELAKVPPGDLINRMNININTNQIKKTSTLEEQDAITKLVQIIETATKQKEDFDKATRDFYTVYDKLKIAIMDACDTGPRLCGVVNSAIKSQKKNS